MRLAIGKASFDTDKLVENLAALISAPLKARPTAAKGRYLKKITVSSTMGHGLDLDVAKAQAIAER